jgi:hypothetical protein
LDKDGRVDALLFYLLGGDRENIKKIGVLCCVSSHDDLSMDKSGVIYPRGIWGIKPSKAKFKTTAATCMLSDGTVLHAKFDSNGNLQNIFEELASDEWLSPKYIWRKSNGPGWLKEVNTQPPFSYADALLMQKVLEEVIK